MMYPDVKRIFTVTTLFLLAVSQVFLQAEERENFRGTGLISLPKILYINSYHRGYYWGDEVESGLLNGIKEKFPHGYDLRIEYLDGKHLLSAQRSNIEKLYIDLFRKKYSDIKFDLIIITDQDAYNFFRALQPQIPYTVPVIFAGVESIGLPLYNSFGISSGTEPKKNLEFILTLKPGIKKCMY